MLKRICLFMLAFVLLVTVYPAADTSAAPKKEVKVLAAQVTAKGAGTSAAPSDAVIKADGDYFTEPKIEEVSVNEKKGRWLYRSNTLYVNVTRVFIKKKVQTYFVADIRFRAPEAIRFGFANPKKPGTGTAALYKIARKYQAVIAVNGDFMRRGHLGNKGLIMRNGKIYNDIKGRGSRAGTLAFYSDGSMRLHGSNTSLKKKLQAAGVKNTVSFGPTLVSKGAVCKNLRKRPLYSRSPRTAVGMVEPYHFIFIVVDGRKSRYSVGMTHEELAKVFVSLGCTMAFNLDGGQSSTMSFMGKNINKYKGSTLRQRHVTDALMFGYSKKVPKK